MRATPSGPGGQPQLRASHRAPGPSLARHRSCVKSPSSRRSRGHADVRTSLGGRARGLERRLCRAPERHRCRDCALREALFLQRGLRVAPGSARRGGPGPLRRGSTSTSGHRTGACGHGRRRAPGQYLNAGALTYRRPRPRSCGSVDALSRGHFRAASTKRRTRGLALPVRRTRCRCTRGAPVRRR